MSASTIPATAYGPPGPPRLVRGGEGPGGGSPGTRIDAPQCWRCERTLADYLTLPFSLRCPKCKAQVTG